jgi:DNA-binding transcriptional ArsR family regulator
MAKTPRNPVTTSPLTARSNTDVGTTACAVQRIIADLEEAGFLERERIGRQNRYRIRTDQALRHPIEAHRTVGDLVGLIHKR